MKGRAMRICLVKWRLHINLNNKVFQPTLVIFSSRTLLSLRTRCSPPSLRKLWFSSKSSTTSADPLLQAAKRPQTALHLPDRKSLQMKVKILTLIAFRNHQCCTKSKPQTKPHYDCPIPTRDTVCGDVAVVDEQSTQIGHLNQYPEDEVAIRCKSKGSLITCSPATKVQTKSSYSWVANHVWSSVLEDSEHHPLSQSDKTRESNSKTKSQLFALAPTAHFACCIEQWAYQQQDAKTFELDFWQWCSANVRFEQTSKTDQTVRCDQLGCCLNLVTTKP